MRVVDGLDIEDVAVCRDEAVELSLVGVGGTRGDGYHRARRRTLSTDATAAPRGVQKDYANIYIIKNIHTRTHIHTHTHAHAHVHTLTHTRTLLFSVAMWVGVWSILSFVESGGIGQHEASRRIVLAYGHQKAAYGRVWGQG